MFRSSTALPNRVSAKRLQAALLNSSLLDISRWRSICAVTLTLKQALWSDGFRVGADEHKCSAAFRNFTKRLNRRVYGASARAGKKRLRILAALEKAADGRFHYHVAVEPPLHLAPHDFEAYVRHCWAQVDWAHDRISIEFGADEGWVNYMLKLRQKSGFESWSDCMDWHNCYNG